MAPVNTIESLNTGSLRKISDPGGGGGGTNSEKMANTTSISRKISSPSCQALQTAVSTLYRMDDFDMTKIGAGFFSEVYKVTHKTSDKVMVLKLNKNRSNRTNMLKEVQLMNQLNHPNILRLEAACVHEGQLHALTEYINGGSLEQLIQRKEEELPWSLRIALALDIAKGLAYLHSKGMFHRDLTSKNVLIQREGVHTKAVIGDFGLAAKIPSRSNKLDNIRLPQVGSPYWMSPECLRGKYYDEKADMFSYGIIMCELIGRVDADPDVLPRTENFGVDYIEFSKLCPTCPPEFLELTYNCVKIDPVTRPTAQEIIQDLQPLFQSYEDKFKLSVRKVAPGHKRSFSEEEINTTSIRKTASPSEKARFHFKSTVLSIGHEMSMRDPHYRPTLQNPFTTLPRLREGKKIMGSSRDLFSSCFELPSPARVATPTQELYRTSSLVNLDQNQVGSSMLTCSMLNGAPTSTEAVMRTRFEDHLFHGRVELLKRLYSGGVWTTQDDSVLSSSSGSSASSMTSNSSNMYLWKRRGSLESGFCSDDWLSVQLSTASEMTRSMGSSLLTVSDLEEDLRAASAFLSSTTNHKRTSSIFTDSNDDLSSLAEETTDLSSLTSKGAGASKSSTGYEKDIRNIVEYFEASCKISRPRGHHHLRLPKYRAQLRSEVVSGSSHHGHHHHQHLEDIRLSRSQKIESLIKRVVEKESRDRLRKTTSVTSSSQQQRLQVCDGIVRSKLQVFDETKRPISRLPLDHKGFVKAKLAIFDPSKAAAQGQMQHPSSSIGNAKRLAEKRLLALANNSSNSRVTSLQKEFK